jgi:hypothetical protein
MTHTRGARVKVYQKQLCCLNKLIGAAAARRTPESTHNTQKEPEPDSLALCERTFLYPVQSLAIKGDNYCLAFGSRALRDGIHSQRIDWFQECVFYSEKQTR